MPLSVKVVHYKYLKQIMIDLYEYDYLLFELWLNSSFFNNLKFWENR